MPVQDQSQLPSTQQFFLQGFNEYVQYFAFLTFNREKAEIQRLMAKNDISAAKERFLRNVNIEHCLCCPLGASYFHTYLSREHNVENLQAYFEAKQLSDLLLTSHKTARFNLDLLREYDSSVEKQLEDLTIDEPCPVESTDSDKQCSAQFLNLSQEKKQEIKKHFCSDRSEYLRVEARIQKFLNKYIGRNATNEVNVAATTQQSFTRAFDEFKQNFNTNGSVVFDDEKSILEKKHIIVDSMEKRAEIIEKVLQKFREEILVNLTDPCKRLFHSKILTY
jgi:hypothetical protein